MAKPRWPLWALGWLLALAALAFGTDAWQQADWALAEASSTQAAAPWPQDLVLIDLPHDADPAVFRPRLGELAKLLAAQGSAGPKAVVFDVHFTRIPNDPALPPLLAALRALQASGAKVYAAVDPRHPRSGQPWPGYAAEHEPQLYEGLFDGQGHTVFDQHGGLVKYEPRLALGASVALSSLVVRLAEAHYNRPLNVPDQPLLLHLGNLAVTQAHTWRFEQGELKPVAGSGAVDLRQRVVIVGSLQADRTPAAQASGPEHLAWALAARAAPPDAAEARLLANAPWLLALCGLSGALAAGCALWAYRRGAGSAWRALWQAGIAVAVPLLALAGVAAALRAAGLVLAQLTLPALGVLAAAVLSAVFTWRYRLWAALHAAAPQQMSSFDVFVSYSRTDATHVAWVREHIVAVLKAMTRPDGSALRVFFDTHEIKVGDRWFDRLVNAVGASRCFLPVYSSDYHAKHFCQYELAAALRRHIQGQAEVVPVRCGNATVPVAASGIQFISAESPGFMQQVQARLDAAWRADLHQELSGHGDRRVDGHHDSRAQQ